MREKYLNIKQLKNSTRQFFILGIRFQGYDKYGTLLTGKETINGRVLDPAGSGNGLFETFYEILFRKVSFKIDGKATVYNIEAISNEIFTTLRRKAFLGSETDNTCST